MRKLAQTETGIQLCSTWGFFLRSWPKGTRSVFLKFCCYIWIFINTHYLSLSWCLSSVSCCAEINYSICVLLSILICQHFSNPDQVSHLHLTPWHRLPDRTNIPTKTEQQTRSTGNNHRLNTSLQKPFGKNRYKGSNKPVPTHSFLPWLWVNCERT